MYENMTEDKALEIIGTLNEQIGFLTKENNELKELYKYSSEQHLEIGLLFAEKIMESLKYQEELRKLKLSLYEPFDVKEEMAKIKKELRALEGKDEQ